MGHNVSVVCVSSAMDQDVSLCLCAMCDHICCLCVMCHCVFWNGCRCTKAGVEEEELCNVSVVCLSVCNVSVRDVSVVCVMCLLSVCNVSVVCE